MVGKGCDFTVESDDVGELTTFRELGHGPGESGHVSLGEGGISM